MKLAFIYILIVGNVLAQTSTLARSFEITENTAPIIFAAQLQQPIDFETVIKGYDPNY